MLNAFNSPCDATVLQFLHVEHECDDSTWFSLVKCLLFCIVWLKTIDLLKAVVSCTVKYLQTVWSLMVKYTLSLFNFLIAWNCIPTVRVDRNPVTSSCLCIMLACGFMVDSGYVQSIKC